MQPDDSSSTVLRRKATVARLEHDARALTPGKCLRLALELTGDELYKLAMTVNRVEERELTHGDLRAEVARLGGPMGAPPQEEEAPQEEGARDPADLTGPLLLLLDGPEGARGAVIVGRALVQALIEVQTMGKVSSQPAPERAFTPTDAAVCAPLLNTLFAGFGDKMEDLREGIAPKLAYRFGDAVEDARALCLALEAETYELIELDVDVVRGKKSGGLTVILPAPILPPAARLEAGAEEAPGFNLAGLAMQAPVTLSAVLDRVEMSLRDVYALKPGTVIPVAMQALDRAELVASQGHVVARVRLGQMNGLRAVRLANVPRTGAQAGIATDQPDRDAPALPRREAGEAGGFGALGRRADRNTEAATPLREGVVGRPDHPGQLPPDDPPGLAPDIAPDLAPDIAPDLSDIAGLARDDGADRPSSLLEDARIDPAAGLPGLPDLPQV